MIKIIEENFSLLKFNQKAQHPLQSWQWGEVRKKMGIEILRIGEFDKESLKNVFTISFHKIPFVPLKIGYLPRSVLPSVETLNFLFKYGKRNNSIFIKIEPYEEKSNPAVRERWGEIKNSKFKIVNSPHPLFPNWTQILDLTKSEEELLKKMHHKTRYNIRLAQKKGVTVKNLSNDEGFKIFSRLYFDTCKRQNYHGHNFKYHQTVWNNLKNEIAHILIAFYNNEPLSVYQIWIFKKTAYYVYGGSSEKYRNLMGANLLMWEAIRFSKNMGAKKFDMWGSLPPNYNFNHPWAGFTRFKQGYGTNFIETIGSYDLIINPFFYSIYNLIFKVRQFFLRM
ncbi:MAG: peptidoglycan bridge formation glycyltransferase FemA/FemB family protein [Microgenomates group bacterium]|nr:peptidoglycan bridge formation glycyltransferase FemA/FemB family protein [Microgenomates group bacterium]